MVSQFYMGTSTRFAQTKKNVESEKQTHTDTNGEGKNVGVVKRSYQKPIHTHTARFSSYVFLWLLRALYIV